MWWRFLTFCVLVCVILFVVLSSIHGRPVVHLFFQRCCEDNIENDQVMFENFGNNYLRERLIGVDLVEEANNDTAVEEKDLDEIIESMREILNVHDPVTRERVFQVDGEYDSGTTVSDDSEVEDLNSPEVTTRRNLLITKRDKL